MDAAVWLKDALASKLADPNNNAMKISVAGSVLAIAYAQLVAEPIAARKARESAALTEASIALKAGFRSEGNKERRDHEAKTDGDKPAAVPGSQGATKKSPSTVGPPKAAVDRIFLKNFRRLMRIAFPSFKSKQGVQLLMLSAFLLLRTYLSLKISALTGELAKRMVAAQVRPFFMSVLTLGLISVPASIVNSGLKYLTALLQVSFRENITKHFHRRYLNQEAFFNAVGLGGVDTVEQRITQDVLKWSEDAASLYQTLFKPIIDIVLFSSKIAEEGGWKSPGMIIVYYFFVTIIMRSIAPNFAVLTAQSQHKEARFREAHSKMLTYAEEVSFAHGEKAQVSLLNRLFDTAQLHARVVIFRRSKHNMFEGLLVKYGAVMMGYGACAMTVFSEKNKALSSDQLTGLYIHMSRLLVDLAKAIGQFVMTYKTIASLAGYTHRVFELERSITALEDKSNQTGPMKKGQVIVGENIRFENVPVISPDHTVLVAAMSFFVQPGMNLLISGPNGCGKSSTFRLLGELWPLQGGVIEKPGYEHLYYVPQRPYMSSGTLREQVTYPLSGEESKKISEATLYQCLVDASLEHVLDKQSWNSQIDWSGDALSHGEKQKLAMARLFFHLPRFAILDECSSAVDVDVEQHLYDMCRKKGITLLTIAHRRSVWKYHNWVLRFDGNGGFNFSPVSFPANETIEPSTGALVQMTLTNICHSSDPSLIGKAAVVTEEGKVVPQ